jgi:hypothetical protein
MLGVYIQKGFDIFQEQALANDFAREFERIYNYKQREIARLF